MKLNLGAYAAAARAAAASSRWSPEDVRRFQEDRLRAVVRHAAENVPYYRELYRAHGVDPREIRGLDDLAYLPVSTKADMQQRRAVDLVTCGIDPDRLAIRRSSGSTGLPFTIRRAWFEEHFLNLLRIREHSKIGIQWTDREARVALPGKGLLKKRILDCRKPARELLEELARIAPAVITGYAGALAWLASEAGPEHRRLIRPRIIVSGAETLTPVFRRQLSEAFGARVFDFYGAHEFNLLARECAETGLYHVLDWGLILEVLKDGRPAAEGEIGEVYATALHSFAMPFVRYRVGDLAARGPTPCPCGAVCTTLKSIEGRVMDMFVLPDGAALHPYTLVRPVAHGVPWVRRYQVIQERRDRIRLNVVTLSGYDVGPEQRRLLLKLVREATPTSVELEIVFVDELPPAPSGKVRSSFSIVGN